MSFWQIFGKYAVSDQGETIQRLGGSTSVSSKGTIFNHMGAQKFIRFSSRILALETKKKH